MLLTVTKVKLKIRLKLLLYNTYFLHFGLWQCNRSLPRERIWIIKRQNRSTAANNPSKTSAVIRRVRLCLMRYPTTIVDSRFPVIPWQGRWKINFDYKDDNMGLYQINILSHLVERPPSSSWIRRVTTRHTMSFYDKHWNMSFEY